MTQQNQSGDTPGRWERQARESGQFNQDNQFSQSGQFNQDGPLGRPVAPGPYPAAPGTTVTPGVPGVLTGPFSVAGTAAVLVVLSLAGLFLRWTRVVLDMPAGGGFSLRIEATMNGFGVLRLAENLTGSDSRDIQVEYLVLAVVALLVLCAGVALIVLRRVPVLGAGLLIAGGALETVGALIGLVGDGKDAVTGARSGMSDYEAQLLGEITRNLDVSKGPGQYVVVLAGLLLAALGVWYLVWTLRAQRVAQTGPAVPGSSCRDGVTGVAVGTPGPWQNMPTSTRQDAPAVGTGGQLPGRPAPQGPQQDGPDRDPNP